ncbi:MAG: flagellar basal body-associated FliL family protein [Zoogloeaceae bacterium]|jgi:flagellar FliL protein|nr:flagellar basal body-associated FliL family protein [Zoogloeaceae bacterium]
MAQEKANPSEAASPPKSRKKLLLILLLVFIVIAGLAVAGTLLFLQLKGNSEADEEIEPNTPPAVTVEKNYAVGKAPVFVELDPFTVNLAPEKRDDNQYQSDQYIQVAITLEVVSDKVQPVLAAQMPRIRNNLTMLLSSQTASGLMTVDGKEKLAKEIRQTINNIIDPQPKGQESFAPVVSALFTSFIIQ